MCKFQDVVWADFKTWYEKAFNKLVERVTVKNTVQDLGKRPTHRNCGKDTRKNRVKKRHTLVR